MKMVLKSFHKMNWPESVLKGLEELGFSEATAVQQRVIPTALQGRDVITCAETGSGKTAAYALPLVVKLLESPSRRALVLVPTRELAHQVAEFMRQLTHSCESFLVTSLVGGADIRKQLKSLKRSPRILVATPGRLMDHLRRQKSLLEGVEFLVLDEGDRMLDMGFAPQLDEILNFLTEHRQSMLFTATLPAKVAQLAAKYLNRAVSINVGRTSLPVAAIKQSVVSVSFKEKDEKIVDELNRREGSVIVFTRTKNRTDILARLLKSYGFSVEAIHGGRSQGQRNKALQNFRRGQCRILCATDLAARGLDVPQVEHVINFDLPMMDEDYVHRIGRTARNGATGEALSFVMPEERRAWHSLVRKYQIKGAELEGEDHPVEDLKVSKGRKKTRRKFSRPSKPSDSASSNEPRRDRWRKSKKHKKNSRVTKKNLSRAGRGSSAFK